MATYELQEKTLGEPVGQPYASTEKPGTSAGSDTVNKTTSYSQGDTYATAVPASEDRRSIWQRSIDSFKPPVGEHAPSNASDVENQSEKPVSSKESMFSHEDCG